MPYKPQSVESSPYSSLGVLESGVASSSRYWDSLHSMFQSLVEKKPTRRLAARGLGAAVLAAMALAGGTASASGEKSASASLGATPVDARPNPNASLDVKNKEIAPVLSCKVDSVRRVGNLVVAAGGCKLGAKRLPVKQTKWTWKESSSDLPDMLASACKYGSGKGQGKQFALPTKKPKDLLGTPIGSYMPAFLKGDFKVSARSGKQTAKATGSLTIKTPDSRVICGPPPRLHNVEGPKPLPFSWETPGSFDGSVFKPGVIKSEGNGKCINVPKPPHVEAGFLIMSGTTIQCPQNGYNGYETLALSYSPPGHTAYCRNDINGASSFRIPPDWGPGQVYLRAILSTWDANNVQFPYTDENNNLLHIPDWITLKGTVNPCNEGTGWSGYIPLNPAPTQTTP